ncbi:uncharacterized protein [Prorops nasuta]|uniref:uncharacterized protein n=1 Tax=Prorops nasuta TaxID=863751 RepID=UPI0034D012E7
MSKCHIRCPNIRRELRKAIEDGRIPIPERLKKREAEKLLKKDLITVSMKREESYERVIKQESEELFYGGAGASDDTATQTFPTSDTTMINQVEGTHADSSKYGKRQKQKGKIPKSGELTKQPTPIDTSNTGSLDSEQLSFLNDPSTKLCEDRCPLNRTKGEKAKKMGEKQRQMDHYYVTKGFRYFDDVCFCSFGCVMYHLKNDPLVKSIICSATLFAIGVKLTLELDGWYID